MDVIQELKDEIHEITNRFDTLDQRWDGVKVVSAFAGGGYNHAKYFKRLEKQKLTARLKRRKNKLYKIVAKNGN